MLSVEAVNPIMSCEDNHCVNTVLIIIIKPL